MATKRTVILNDVPKNRVERVEAMFKADGAIAVRIAEPDGQYTIVATYPSGEKSLKE